MVTMNSLMWGSIWLLPLMFMYGELDYIVFDNFENDTGWESGEDTLSEVVLKFSSKEKAIEYAKKNNILYQVIEPKKSNFIIKSYADNFLKE